MFFNPGKKMKSTKLDTSNALNLLIRDTKLTGDLYSEVDVRVDGHVLGNITSTRLLIIGETGVVTGNVEADTLVLFGEITGEYHAANVVRVASTGRYQGNLRAGLLEIESGAKIEGKISRLPHKIPARQIKKK